MSGEGILEVDEKDKPTRTLRREVLSGDAFERLCTPGGIHASVGLNIGTQANFGELKISATVRLQCDQNEGAMDEAAKMAFSKAFEYMRDGFTILAGEST